MKINWIIFLVSFVSGSNILFTIILVIKSITIQALNNAEFYANACFSFIIFDGGIVNLVMKIKSL